MLALAVGSNVAPFTFSVNLVTNDNGITLVSDIETEENQGQRLGICNVEYPSITIHERIWMRDCLGCCTDLSLPRWTPKSTRILSTLSLLTRLRTLRTS